MFSYYSNANVSVLNYSNANASGFFNIQMQMQMLLNYSNANASVLNESNENASV